MTIDERARKIVDLVWEHIDETYDGIKRSAIERIAAELRNVVEEGINGAMMRQARSEAYADAAMIAEEICFCAIKPCNGKPKYTHDDECNACDCAEEIRTRIGEAEKRGYDMAHTDQDTGCKTSKSEAYIDAIRIIEFQISNSLETAFDRILVDGAIAILRARAEELSSPIGTCLTV